MLLHLITISVGFIIAFGLQQLVDRLRRRNRIRRARAAGHPDAPLKTPPGAG
jgi:hypothetical protein